MDARQGKQKSTEALEEAAKDVETFNPLWNDGEFMGPNAVRYKNVDDEGDGE